jgi:hypothetical protein
MNLFGSGPIVPDFSITVTSGLTPATDPFCLSYPEHQSCAPLPVNYFPHPGGTVYVGPPPGGGGDTSMTNNSPPKTICHPDSGECVTIGGSEADGLIADPLAALPDLLAAISAQRAADYVVPAVSVSLGFSIPFLPECPICTIGGSLSLTVIPPQNSTVSTFSFQNATIGVGGSLELGLGLPGPSASVTAWANRSMNAVSGVLCEFTHFFTLLPPGYIGATSATSAGNTITGLTVGTSAPSFTLGSGYTVCR